MLAAMLSSSLAIGQEIDVDKTILTAPKFDPAGQPLGGPVTFRCDEFELRFSAKAKPVSLKRLADGEELIRQGSVSEGFYLNSFKGRIPFESLSRREDGSYVVMTPNKTQRVIFTVQNRGKYLAFRMQGMHGIPASNNLTLHFEIHCDHNVVRAFGLDYMTEDWGSFPVTWRWIWHRGPGIPRGAFAMYLKNSDEDEDDKLLRIRVSENLPHPALESRWDEKTAKAWMIRISHVGYDGLSPCVWAMGEFAYRKWLGEAYVKFDHPMTYATGYGEARRWGHFEYRFNAVKKLRGKILGPRGDIGARIRTWHVSRPSSTIDEAQFRMSQPAAFNNPNFPLFTSVHYPSKWPEYGNFEAMCQLVKSWKTASRGMTDAQRQRILATLHEPMQRGFQSDIVWRLRDEGDAYRIYPSKNPLTRRSGDVRWGCQGGEAGYVEPGQYVKAGRTLELENPYQAQAPKFVIRVMPVWHRKVDMRNDRGIGMWVTGDGSGSLVVLRLPSIRDTSSNSISRARSTSKSPTAKCSGPARIGVARYAAEQPPSTTTRTGSNWTSAACRLAAMRK